MKSSAPSWSLLLRLLLVTAALGLLWRLVLGMPDLLETRPAQRIVQGLLLSSGVLALVATLLRRDRDDWRLTGWPPREGTLLREFAGGALLWLLPAAAGLALCLSMGWVSLSPVAAPSRLLLLLPGVALAVFLSEAFPEELAVRGYIQGLVGRRAAAWVALLAQLAVFILFAWSAGALATPQQWLFLPGLGLILGYARAVSGQVWCCIGIHWAWMTSTQWLLAAFTVEGTQTLLFLAFALLPSTAIGLVLGLRRPGFDWRRPQG